MYRFSYLTLLITNYWIIKMYPYISITNTKIDNIEILISFLFLKLTIIAYLLKPISLVLIINN